MDLYRIGDKPISEPVMTSLYYLDSSIIQGMLFHPITESIFISCLVVRHLCLACNVIRILKTFSTETPSASLAICAGNPSVIFFYLIPIEMYTWLSYSGFIWDILQKELLWIWKYLWDMVIHDDVMKWKHYPRYLPFVWGIHRWPVNSPHKGRWHGALIFSLTCVWINGWVNHRKAGDLRRPLWRHHNGRIRSAKMKTAQYLLSFL